MVLSTCYELPTPLWKDDYGVIHIANTRVTLDVVIAAYQHGATPNEINQGFPTLSLAEIYAVLAYYLSNQEQVHTYLSERDEQTELIYREIEVKRPATFDLRSRLAKGMARSLNALS